MTTATRSNRGWTRHPKIARILKRGVSRFITIYPWAELHPTFNPERDICFLMLTAREILKLHPFIPASVAPQYGHNHGPSWNECVRLAEENPALRFTGFLMPVARADEGIDLDAVYVPQPDFDNYYTRALTRPDGTIHPPDEDAIEQIDGHSFRRLWWD